MKMRMTAESARSILQHAEIAQAIPTGAHSNKMQNTMFPISAANSGVKFRTITKTMATTVVMPISCLSETCNCRDWIAPVSSELFP
jgi:hypothetical protein